RTGRHACSRLEACRAERGTIRTALRQSVPSVDSIVPFPGKRKPCRLTPLPSCRAKTTKLPTPPLAGRGTWAGSPRHSSGMLNRRREGASTATANAIRFAPDSFYRPGKPNALSKLGKSGLLPRLPNLAGGRRGDAYRRGFPASLPTTVGRLRVNRSVL